MIKIKELPEAFKNADSETKRQMRDISVDEAFKEAVSKEEFKSLQEKLDETYAKSLQANRKADIASLDLGEVRKRLLELERKPKSALEYNPVPRTDTGIEPKKVEPSLWSEL